VHVQCVSDRTLTKDLAVNPCTAEPLGDAQIGFTAEPILIFDGLSFVGRMWYASSKQRDEQDLLATSRF